MSRQTANSHPHRREGRGFSLLEVLIALLVVAVGMLGTGLLMAVSIRENQTAATRSAAVLVANSMMDRMSANIVGVWNKDYDGSYSGKPMGPGGCSQCNPDQLALLDRNQWQAELLQALPAGASGNVTCTPRSQPPTALAAAPVYDGYCEIELKWKDNRSDKDSSSNSATEAQDVSWRFVP
ncbi:MAG TPA: type IV pilus modification protein PilV [Burkholderiales bacterium]|nr:type IV pilus modification protein PilV [Burkholderiales bacterium]